MQCNVKNPQSYIHDINLAVWDIIKWKRVEIQLYSNTNANLSLKKKESYCRNNFNETFILAVQISKTKFRIWYIYSFLC